MTMRGVGGLGALMIGLAGCLPAGTVQMTGTVYDSPGGLGAVVGGAHVRTLDGDGATVAEATSDDAGAFTASVPQGTAFYVQVEGPDGAGYTATAFSGESGMTDFDAGTGFPWVASPDWLAALQADWAGCPGADTAGASGVAVVGEVRMWMNVADADTMPVQAAASVVVTPAQGAELSACYHNADGVYDPEATGTGSDGLYAVFGAPAGGLAVSTEYDNGDGTRQVVIYQYMAGEASLVPIYPTFVYQQ